MVCPAKIFSKWLSDFTVVFHFLKWFYSFFFFKEETQCQQFPPLGQPCNNEPVCLCSGREENTGEKTSFPYQQLEIRSLQGCVQWLYGIPLSRWEGGRESFSSLLLSGGAECHLNEMLQSKSNNFSQKLFVHYCLSKLNQVTGSKADTNRRSFLCQ